MTIGSNSRLVSFGLLFAFLLTRPDWAAAQSNPLFIPPTLEGPTYDLTLQRTQHEFFEGINTDTYSFNGTYLGPTLIFNRGDDVQMNVTNLLGESTTVHWHGAHVAAANDGGPHTVIEDQTTWTPAFPVLNRASTLWYHPHLHEHTNEHVYRGLAGVIIVRDAEEAALDLPRSYGIDDIPLILQDRKFDGQGQLVFQAMGRGALGDVFVINGTIDPIATAPAQMVRFRLLNGSGARVYNFGIDGDRMFNQIGLDGGLLPEPLALSRIRLAPGERAEIVVDLSGDEGDTLTFMNFASELTSGERGGTVGPPTTNPLDGTDMPLLAVGVEEPTVDPVLSVPAALIPVVAIEESESVRTRPMSFNADSLGKPFAINGVSLDLDVINEVVNLNDTEIWELTNQTTDPHPFHIHDVTFQILDRDGSDPPENERGWKDVVLVYPGETVRFITRFEDFADPVIPYMYHCHLLDHEDLGMMGQFVVIDTDTGTENLATDPSGMEIQVRNYPNPFREQTTISYSVPERSELRIEAFDILGHRVKILFNGVRDAGEYETIWKSGDLANGSYFVRFATPKSTTSHAVVIARD